MLALVVLVLSVLAAPAESLAEVPPAVQAELVVWADSGCCGELSEADASHPCAPGESCPDAGGCCACVSCCKRVANAPVALRPVASENATTHVLPSGRRAGTEEVGAVWHPPRG
ncbi:hypothetical protein B1759_13555 [Rubrivirga sp. SAORIC476]|uniref:hypothetical protein n=1 Tax=Rubrivirga sp. SAORIC476 TaxID=1961794 RepID=UPI000BA9B58D|nr:hypothetical protein [Rubrivirga sp. SAORIC476]PAP79353.1 hypothetical protein B1759_13555 [Rubrivirga sp. SAORIC476]